MDDFPPADSRANPAFDAAKVTRVVNACVLLEIGEDAVLTDPYFADHWYIPMRERVGLQVERLPRLTAIIGGHGVPDHWQPGSMEAYPYKETTPVFVATRAMMRKARAAGFRAVEVLDWNATRRLSDGLGLEVAPAQTAAGMKVNSYVLSAAGLRLFVGTEARDLEPLRQYREQRPGVDVALLPIDGASIVGHKLVMSSADAIEACRILGARILVPIHYALRPIPLLLQTRSSIDELVGLARHASDLQIVPLETGERWDLKVSDRGESSRAWRRSSA